MSLPETLESATRTSAGRCWPARRMG